MENALLQVENLSVDIPVAAGMLHPVQRVSFEVGRGETLCIVGESGCGKSLTALALMNLLPPRARRNADRLVFGEVDLLEQTERSMSDLRGNRIAMIFQEPMTSLNPSYTIGNQLAEVLSRHRAVTAREARNRAIYLLDRVGVSPAEQRLRQYPHQLSGGLRQRVMIAMALMCGPDLIIADEPTTALDVTTQAQILRLIGELQREFGMALIMITHDLGIVARMADRVVVMYAGEVVETGSAEQIFRSPIHPYTQALLACVPVPGRTRPGELLGAIPGLVPPLIGRFAGCHFANRCARAQDECRASPVAMRRDAQTGRAVRCVRVPDASMRNAPAETAS
jgi:peptide/nickel transport system ATP-binding protein